MFTELALLREERVCVLRTYLVFLAQALADLETKRHRKSACEWFKSKDSYPCSFLETVEIFEEYGVSFKMVFGFEGDWSEIPERIDDPFYRKALVSNNRLAPWYKLGYPSSFEAVTYEVFQGGRWRRVLKQKKDALKYIPKSKRPIQMMVFPIPGDGRSRMEYGPRGSAVCPLPGMEQLALPNLDVKTLIQDPIISDYSRQFCLF